MSYSVRIIESDLIKPEDLTVEQLRAKVEDFLGWQVSIAAYPDSKNGSVNVEVTDLDDVPFPSGELRTGFREDVEGYIALFGEGSSVTYLVEDDLSFFRTRKMGGVTTSYWNPFYDAIPFK